MRTIQSFSALMLPVSFGISAFCPDLFSLHSIEAQARTALLQHLLISDKRVFRWQSALEAASPDRLPFYEDRLLSALIAGDAAQAVELCSAALYELGAHDGASACDLHMQLLQIYCTLLKIDCPCRAMIEREINELSLRSLLRFDSINVLLEHIAALCRLICAQILQSRSATTALVESVRKYIDEHYGSHITLQVLAELFHVNASYLSQIFKRQIGVGVNRYLRGARLSAAKRMLAGTDGRLSDICMQCGFSDYVHFSKTFKEEFGLSPSDYRKNH